VTTGNEPSHCVDDVDAHLTTIAIDVAASPEEVFDVLDDAGAYPRWVVGTRRIRRVDDAWPAVGSRFFHAVGVAPAEIHDWSRVCVRDRPRRLVLEVRFWPTGTACVTIAVEPTPTGARVTLGETPTAGPAALVPAAVAGPVLWCRNRLSLHRLRRVLERRARGVRGEG
jgi:uncharacterized protein YndB with AHSA1/START domain